jgi:hypothetical protein
MGKQYDLKTDFELTGFFWIPGEEAKKMPGTLKHVSGEMLELRIYEEGGLFSKEAFTRNSEIDVLQGVAFNEDPDIPGGDQAITLYKLNQRKETHSSFGTSRRTYNAQFAFLGHILFEDEKDISFEQVLLHIDQFENWLQPKPFEYQIEFDGSQQLKSIQARYEPKDNMEHRIEEENLNFLIDGSVNAPFFAGYKRIKLEYTPQIIVKPDQSASIEYFTNVLFHLRKLLTLLTGKLVYFDSLAGRHSDGLESPEYVQIIFPERRKENYKEWHDHEIMLSYPEISNSFSEILEAWFSKKEKLESILNLLMGTIYGTQWHIEINFDRLANALEAYHRNLIHEQPMQFNKRLLDIFKHLPANLKALITNAEDEFILKINDSRNYYTHYNPQDRDKALKDEELYWASKKIQMLLSILLLRELSIEDDKIEYALKKNPEFAYLIQHYSQEDGNNAVAPIQVVKNS